MTNVAGFFNQIVLPINLYIYEGIKNLYNLMLYIAESQIVSNETISSFSSRIYVLLGIFMLFKLSFSLVTYVINPDEFFDKTKGITSIGKNIIISLVLIVLTPYLFQESRELQKNILNEHVVENLVFGDTKISYTRMNSGGDLIQFSLFAQWIKPNPEIEELKNCNNIYLFEDDGTAKMDNGKYALNETDCMTPLKAKFESDKIKDSGAYSDYEDGLKNKNVAYFYNSRIFTAEEDGKFLVKYNSLFSIISGIIVIFILISFCFDIAVRSIKLAFFQIMAPIPIISLCDPKGKDGMFKKWGTSVVKTYLSLFVRLVALYFSISIINQILIDPKWHQIESITEGFATAFIIIGTLMFAKQLPGILSEITGVKLDSKFNLNPFKRVEEDAIGGKRITGALAGGAIGTVGAFTGAGLLRGFTGLVGGFASGKGFSDSLKAQRDKNTKARSAYIKHATPLGRLRAGVEEFAGTGGEMARIEAEKQRIKDEIDREDFAIKGIEDQKNQIKGSEAYRNRQREMEQYKSVSDDVVKVKQRAQEQIKNGVGVTGARYDDLMRRASEARANNDGALAAQYEQQARNVVENNWQELVDEVSANNALDRTLAGNIEYAMDSYSRAHDGATLTVTNGHVGDALNGALGEAKQQYRDRDIAGRADEAQLKELDRQIAEHNDAKAPHNERLRDLEIRESRAKANSDSRPFQ